MLVVQPGRGRRHQGLRRPAHRGHLGRRVQVRLDREARPPGHLVRAAAHRQVHAEPAHLRGRGRAHVDPHAQLVAGHQRGPQPRRPPLPHRRQVARRPSTSASTSRCRSTCPTPGRRRSSRMVGTMQNLVNEVLQSAVGNYFRNKLQTLGRHRVHREARRRCRPRPRSYIRSYLDRYEVETRGVYIQDVVFPADLVAGAHQPGDRRPGEADLRQPAGRPGSPRRARAAARRRRHAGPAGPGQRVDRHRVGQRQGRRRPGRGRGRGHHRHRQRRGQKIRAIGGATAEAEQKLGPGPGQRLRGPAAGHRPGADRAGGGPARGRRRPREDHPRHRRGRERRHPRRPRCARHAGAGRPRARARRRGPVAPDAAVAREAAARSGSRSAPDRRPGDDSPGSPSGPGGGTLPAAAGGAAVLGRRRRGQRVVRTPAVRVQTLDRRRSVAMRSASGGWVSIRRPNEPIMPSPLPRSSGDSIQRWAVAADGC